MILRRNKEAIIYVIFSDGTREKILGYIITHWDYWRYIITIMKVVGVVLGLSGIILLRK